MTDQPAPADKYNSAFFFKLLCAYLILLLGWRLFLPAHEYPGRAGLIFDMATDAGALLAVILLRAKGPPALFWAAVIAGLGLFAIRMTSDASWWTGHLTYSLN